MPVAAALPYISAATGLLGAVGGMSGHKGHTAQVPDSTAALRNFFAQFLQGNTGAGTGPASMLTVPGFDSAGNPNGPLARINNLFDATRAEALGSAKEQAGNLTGSGAQNLFGSALATSLASQQKMIGDLGMQGALANQGTFANLFNSFGNTGVSTGIPTYQPGALSGLSGLSGPLGTLAGMFPSTPSGGGGGVTTTGDPNNPYGIGTYNNTPGR